ncbi:MAG: hypothetical protein DMG42_21030 [Acidobacteria bacterium]|nr:MAG: hypothetical protein DMG42_21030 [Acidobacteriota bacterium]
MVLLATHLNTPILEKLLGPQTFLREAAQSCWASLGDPWLVLQPLDAILVHGKGRCARCDALGPSGTVARKQLVKLAATMWIAARITNYLTSGQPHDETPFGVSVQAQDGKQHVYTLRSQLTDALHLVQDTRSFALNRLSPAVKTGVEIAAGRDVRGRAVTPGDTALNAVSNATPIPLQSALHYFNSEAPQRDGFAQVLQSLGAANYIYKTQAEKLAGQLASSRAPSGPVDSAQLARHLQKLRTEDELRQGGQPNLLLFAPNDRREIARNARLTPLQARFARLPMADALQVWDAATASEKSELAQEFIKKKNAYMRRAYSEGPEGRAKDRIYQRLAKMFAERAPDVSSTVSSTTAPPLPAGGNPFDSAFQ